MQNSKKLNWDSAEIRHFCGKNVISDCVENDCNFFFMSYHVRVYDSKYKRQILLALLYKVLRSVCLYLNNFRNCV